MQKIKTYIICLTVFLTPLFFLPITHEFYNVNKFLLIASAAVILLSISTVQFVLSRNLRWSKEVARLLIPISIFLVLVFLSTLLGSTNKMQSMLNLTFGPLFLAALTILFWYVAAEENDDNISLLFRFGGLCISIITLIFSLHPFNAVDLPKTFQFLKNQQFSPIGTQVDLILFLGFISIYQLLHAIKVKKQSRRTDIFSIIGLSVSIIAVTVSLTNFFSTTEYRKSLNTAPLNSSLKVASRALSTPTGFLFGTGIDSFGAIFTEAKDSTYNLSSYWSQSSFENAPSAFLLILIESGVTGMIALIGLFVFGFRHSKNDGSFYLLLYLAFAFIVTPASLILFFLLYLCLGLSVSGQATYHKKISHIVKGRRFIPAVTLSILALTYAWYVFWFIIVPTYQAEVAMRSSIDAITNNDLQGLYDQQYKAVILNPYIERYRLNFSQTNLFVAKQVAAQSTTDQSIVTQSVQRAINEAQAAVSLNSKRASNWENLGIIYKNVLGVKGAEQWAVAAFQRAILLDPQNVSYRLELGGVYYTLKQYENAAKTFQDTVLLKPDLPNAYYNLAYAHYQNKNTNKAVEVMDTLLSLLKKQSSSNYEKVLKERQGFASGAPQNQVPSVLQ